MGSNLDLVIVGVYMCVLVLIGLVFGRLVKSGSDYFKAGAKGSWWMVGSSMFMSGISAYTFVGNAAGIYKSGWSPFAIYLANVCGFILAAVFLGAWYRQMRVVTYAEVIKERFGKTSEQIVAHLLVLNGFMWAGIGLYTLAVFITPLVPGVPVQGLIISVGFVVVVYCTVGGNWAVMANDFVQGLVLIIVTIIVTVLCFMHAGGIGEFFSAIKSSSAASDLKLITPIPAGETFWSAKYGLTWFVVVFIIQFFNQSSLFQGVRYFSAKDGREARKASIFAAVMMLMGLVVFFVPPIYARIFLEPEVLAMHESPMKAVEYSYSVASFHLLPKGTFSIMIVAIFAAAISSLDTGLNRNAALIIRDLMPAHRKLLKMKPMNPDREVILGKITTILAGCVVVGVALIYSTIKSASIFDIMLTVVAQLIAPQVTPLVLFMFIRKVPRWAILSSLAGGYLPSLVLWAISANSDLVFSYQQKGLMVFIGGVVGFLIARLLWNRTSEEEKESTATFYAKMERPIDFKNEVGAGNDSFQLIMIGRFALLLGGLFLFLLIPVDTTAGRWVILSISGFVGGIGLLMLLSGKRILKKES
jgi:solute:Na+ symporter, SSS family